MLLKTMLPMVSRIAHRRKFLVREGLFPSTKFSSERHSSRNLLRRVSCSPMQPYSSSVAQIQAQIQEQERKLRIRDEWQRALDELEAENQRKKVELEAEIQRKKLELNKRYTEQLALQDQPAPPILLPGSSQANVSPNAERSMPAAPPAAAAAASHDHQVLLSNGSLTGGAPGAKSAADGSPYAGEAVDQPMSDDLAGPSGQQDDTGAAMDFSDGGAEDNTAEPFPDSMVPDSEDEAEASDLLHATRDAPRQSVETRSRLADSSHSNTDEDEAQASGQAGSRERADAEAASGSGAVTHCGPSAGLLKGRQGDTFYAFREPRSLSDARKILCLFQGS